MAVQALSCVVAGLVPRNGNCALYADPIGFTAIMADPHPGEPRMLAIGRTEAGRYVFLVFMFRTISSQTRLRPISARYMHQKEIDHYEQ